MRLIPFFIAFLSSTFVAGVELNELENEIRNLQTDDAVVRFVFANRQLIEDNLSKLDDDTRRKVEDTLLRNVLGNNSTFTVPSPTAGSDDSVSNSGNSDTEMSFPVYLMLVLGMNFLF